MAACRELGNMDGRRRKVHVKLHGKDNSSSHGARPVHQIIAMIKLTRTRRLSINSKSRILVKAGGARLDEVGFCFGGIAVNGARNAESESHRGLNSLFQVALHSPCRREGHSMTRAILDDPLFLATYPSIAHCMGACTAKGS